MRDGYGKLDGYGSGAPKDGFGSGIFRDGYGRGDEYEGRDSCALSEEDWGMVRCH